jgi:hypothetical protein
MVICVCVLYDASYTACPLISSSSRHEVTFRLLCVRHVATSTFSISETFTVMRSIEEEQRAEQDDGSNIVPGRLRPCSRSSDTHMSSKVK